MRPHRTDGVSLSFGLLFLIVASWWAVSQVVSVRLPQPGWIAAGGLILFGAVGLFGAIRSNRREQPVHVAATTTAPAAPAVELPDDVPPEMLAKFVQELLNDPGSRFAGDQPPAEGSRTTQ
jgi:hypothetical protein